MAVILNDIMKNDNQAPNNYSFSEYSQLTNIDDNLTIVVYTATKLKAQRHIAKINKNTIDNLFKSKQHDKLVENTVTILNQFENIDVMASGIETKEQAEFMRKCGATLATGNLYTQEEFVNKFFK